MSLSKYLAEREWWRMKTKPLNELFDVTYGNKFDFNKMEIATNGGVNFVGRSSQNHGVSVTCTPDCPRL